MTADYSPAPMTAPLFLLLFQKFRQDPFDEIIVTDTISYPPELLAGRHNKITVILVAPLLGKAIQIIHSDKD